MNKVIHVTIDASDTKRELDRLAKVMTPERFEQCMYGIFKRTGGHVRKILRTDLPHDYHVKAGQISSAVNGISVTSGGVGGVGCTIPIRDTRGDLGGRYKAIGGTHGWSTLRMSKSRRAKKRIKAKVVKANISVLPPNMPNNYGGQPPFRNLNAPSLHGLVFTRRGKPRLPIRKVMGIAIPQMPMNRSEDEVQADIKKYLEDRINHEFMRLIGGG